MPQGLIAAAHPGYHHPLIARKEGRRKRSIRKNTEVLFGDLLVCQSLHQDVWLHHRLHKAVLKLPLLAFLFQDWTALLLREFIKVPNVSLNLSVTRASVGVKFRLEAVFQKIP
jgi:hypothetical protein